METSRPIATAEMQRQITSEVYAQDGGTYRCTLTLRDGTQIAGHRSYGQVLRSMRRSPLDYPG